uniref:Uncharacterized protein n=1 Tax=Rhizophora mucronata TaxID=61149 RepID=A0A2P2PQ67_RHIMU
MKLSKIIRTQSRQIIMRMDNKSVRNPKVLIYSMLRNGLYIKLLTRNTKAIESAVQFQCKTNKT